MARLAAGTGQLSHASFTVPLSEDRRRLASLFKASRADPDFEHVLVDATICKTHPDAISQTGGLTLPGSAAPEAA